MDEDRSLPSAPIVVFTSRPNSHPFQERHIAIREPVKIGRSVARAHPAPTNAIFDCKVLSRNHALVWFEDNKFYLQDTKSSNGTFVNNQRLSKGSEESDAHEVFSGDIIQFGVDVMENSKRVTHGCIMASITLYLPDGTEAKPRFSGRSQTAGHSMSAVHSQEMYQLSQYLQEALHREQILQDKMSHLQALLHSTTASCDSSWHALINEDRLLSKLEVLQNQLSAFSQNQTEGSLQQQIMSLEEEKLNRETTTKQSLRKVLEEKILAIQDLSDVKRSLDNTEQEFKHLKNLYEESQHHVSDVTEKYDEKICEFEELRQKLQEAEKQLEEELPKHVEEKEQLQAKLEEAFADRDSLQAKVSYLQLQVEEKVTAAGTALHNNGDGGGEDVSLNNSRVNGEHSLEEGERDDQDDKQSELELVFQKELLESLQSQLEDAEDRISEYQSKFDDADRLLLERDEEVKNLTTQLENSQLQIVEYVTKVATLEEKMKSAGPNSLLFETTVASEALPEEVKQISQAYEETIKHMKEEIQTLKTSDQATSAHDEVKDLTDKLTYAQNVTEEMKGQISTIQDQLNCEQKLHTESRQKLDQLRDELDEARKEMASQSTITQEFKEKTEKLERQLTEVSEKHRVELDKTQCANQQLQKDYSDNKEECEALKSECDSLRTRVQAIEAELQRLQQDNTQLDSEISKTQVHNKQLEDEIVKLNRSYEELKLLKESLENQNVTVQENLTDTQKEANLYRERLELEQQEKETILEKYNSTIEELTRNQQLVDETQKQHSQAAERLETVELELSSVKEKYKQLSERSSEQISLFSALPVMVLVLAVVIAIFPMLSRITSASNAPS